MAVNSDCVRLAGRIGFDSHRNRERQLGKAVEWKPQLEPHWNVLVRVDLLRGPFLFKAEPPRSQENLVYSFYIGQISRARG